MSLHKIISTFLYVWIKRSCRMLWIHKCKATGGYLPWRDDVPFVTSCRRLSVSLKVGVATEAGLLFLLRYLQVNNLCPTLKSREIQCGALLCEPSWDMSIVWGKLSFNRIGFHMALKMWSDTEHVIANWDELQDFFFPLHLLDSSNSIVQMWGFHPVVGMHPALWLERQGCKWHLILPGDPPKIIFPHEFYCFSLKEHLWSQPKTSHILHVGFSELLRQWPRCFFKEKSTLTSWRDFLTIFHKDGPRSCPLSFTSKKRMDTRRGWRHWVLAPSALNILVNVIDSDSAGEDLEFIYLQYFPVAIEMCSSRSLLGTGSAFSSKQEGFLSDSWVETTYSY